MITHPHGSTSQLFPVVDQDNRSKGQRSYIIASAGTAGTNKALTFVNLMSEAGRGGKIQSVLPEDRNTRTQKKVKDIPSGVHVIQPTFLPRGLGYNRNPDGWLSDKPAIVKDQYVMVRNARIRANKLQEEPQLLISFMGLAAHCHIGISLLDKLFAEFPNTTPLMVLSLPGERGVRKIASDRELIAAYKPIFLKVEERAGIVLLVDEFLGAGNFRRFDYKIGMALASIEVSNAANNGSLADCVGALRMVNDSSYWYGLSVIDPPHRLSTGRNRTTGEFGPIDGSNKVLLRDVVSVVEKIWAPDYRLANHGAVAEGSYAEIAAVLPVRGDQLQDLSVDWKEAIGHGRNTAGNGWAESDSEISSEVRFGPANFPESDSASNQGKGVGIDLDEEDQTPATHGSWKSRWLPSISTGSWKSWFARKSSLAKGEASDAGSGNEPDLFFHVSAIYPIAEAASGYQSIPSIQKLWKDTSHEQAIPNSAHPLRNGKEPEILIPGNTK